MKGDGQAEKTENGEENERGFQTAQDSYQLDTKQIFGQQ